MYTCVYIYIYIYIYIHTYLHIYIYVYREMWSAGGDGLHSVCIHINGSLYIYYIFILILML